VLSPTPPASPFGYPIQSWVTGCDRHSGLHKKKKGIMSIEWLAEKKRIRYYIYVLHELFGACCIVLCPHEWRHQLSSHTRPLTFRNCLLQYQYQPFESQFPMHGRPIADALGTEWKKIHTTPKQLTSRAQTHFRTPRMRRNGGRILFWKDAVRVMCGNRQKGDSFGVSGSLHTKCRTIKKI